MADNVNKNLFNVYADKKWDCFFFWCTLVDKNGQRQTTMYAISGYLFSPKIIEFFSFQVKKNIIDITNLQEDGAEAGNLKVK